MRRLFFVAALVASGAFVLPFAVQASRDELQLMIVPPISFAQPADCPTGAIGYGISLLHGKGGTGSNCILGDDVPGSCPSGVTADFCARVGIRMTLSLPGGTIEAANGQIFEAWTCAGGAYLSDGTCSSVWNIDQRWSGAVTAATGRFHALADGAVSGGGLLVFDGPTFSFVSIDETLVIGVSDT
jgi:hypothetical protein